MTRSLMTHGPIPSFEGLLESLAALEHTRWVRYMRHMFGKCRRVGQGEVVTIFSPKGRIHEPMQIESQQIGPGSLIVPSGYVQALESLMETDYWDLSEEQKQNDRKEILNTAWPMLREFFPGWMLDQPLAIQSGVVDQLVERLREQMNAVEDRARTPERPSESGEEMTDTLLQRFDRQARLRGVEYEIRSIAGGWYFGVLYAKTSATFRQDTLREIVSEMLLHLDSVT